MRLFCNSNNDSSKKLLFQAAISGQPETDSDVLMPTFPPWPTSPRRIFFYDSYFFHLDGKVRKQSLKCVLITYFLETAVYKVQNIISSRFEVSLSRHLSFILLWREEPLAHWKTYNFVWQIAFVVINTVLPARQDSTRFKSWKGPPTLEPLESIKE